MAVKETLYIRLERYFREDYLPKRDQSIIVKKKQAFSEHLIVTAVKSRLNDIACGR